jgi:nucleotide sugar dehydrogenase
MTHAIKNKEHIGFIGQGWIGKHLADNFEVRGYPTTRYAKEPPHDQNLEKLEKADIIFVAVPTPSTPHGFDDSILRTVISLAKEGQTVVIKSTILPGTTDQLAKDHPGIYIFHSPEFLREASVTLDIEKPDRNIVGIPSQHIDDPKWIDKANQVLSVLPPAPYSVVCSAPEAELIKYGGNNFLYMKVVYMNMLYDLAQHHGARWEVIADTMTADPRIGASHMQPVHQHIHMGEKVGRGAGGHCFIKDFAAMRYHFEDVAPEEKETINLLRAFEAKNNHLLVSTGKDQDLLFGVYGDNVLCVCKVADGKTSCACAVSA